MKDVSELNKDELQDYLKHNDDGIAFKQLDLRKGIDKLRAEVKAMQSKPSNSVVEQSKPKAYHIKNKATGFVFEYTEVLFNHLGDNGVLCDSEGVEI